MPVILMEVDWQNIVSLNMAQAIWECGLWIILECKRLPTGLEAALSRAARVG